MCPRKYPPYFEVSFNISFVIQILKLLGIWNEFLDLKVVKENCGGQSLVSHPTIPTLLCSHPCVTPAHEGRQGLWLLTSSLWKGQWDVTPILRCYVRFPFSVLNHGFCEVNGHVGKAHAAKNFRVPFGTMSGL